MISGRVGRVGPAWGRADQGGQASGRLVPGRHGPAEDVRVGQGGSHLAAADPRSLLHKSKKNNKYNNLNSKNLAKT